MSELLLGSVVVLTMCSLPSARDLPLSPHTLCIGPVLVEAVSTTKNHTQADVAPRPATIAELAKRIRVDSGAPDRRWNPNPEYGRRSSRSDDERSWAGRHAVGLGVLIGAGLGTIVGYTTGVNCDGEGSGFCNSRGTATALGAAVGAAGGGLVGWLLGRTGG